MKNDLFNWATKAVENINPPIDASFEILPPETPMPMIPIPREFSLLPVKDQLEAFRLVVDSMAKTATALTIIDTDSNKEAVSLAGKAKNKWAEIEKVRKEILSPHQEFTKAVNNLAKDCQEPLKDIENVLKRKLSDYDAKMRLEYAKAQEAARQQAAKLEAELKAQAAAANVPPPLVVTPIIPDAPPPTRTENGTASQVTTWEFELVDAIQVPREYLTVNEQLIRQAVRNGVREIPGVRIFEKTSTRIRR